VIQSDIIQPHGDNMHWIKIEHAEVPVYLCLETGIQLRLNHTSKNEYGIHSTGFGGIIKVLSRDKSEAEKQFYEFISQLTPIGHTT